MNKYLAHGKHEMNVKVDLILKRLQLGRNKCRREKSQKKLYCGLRADSGYKDPTISLAVHLLRQLPYRYCKHSSEMKKEDINQSLVALAVEKLLRCCW